MNKRFYDQDPPVKQSMEMMLLFPSEVQTVIADGLALIAERECRADEVLRNVKSLGSEKIMALYKSKQKNRAYDKNPAVHKAVNYLMILSPENRRLLAWKIKDLIGFIRDYMKLCAENQQVIQTGVLQNISTTYVRRGNKEAQHLIEALRQGFVEAAPRVEPKANTQAKPGETKLREEIETGNTGMKIRGDIVF